MSLGRFLRLEKIPLKNDFAIGNGINSDFIQMSRAVATTLSPLCKSASAHNLPKPREAPLIKIGFVIAVIFYCTSKCSAVLRNVPLPDQ
jgi:hypothetical protein